MLPNTIDAATAQWRERYMRRGPFVAAADQAVRYGRQMAVLNPQSTHDAQRIFNAWLAFISQFRGNVREVLTRTFWEAFYA